MKHGNSELKIADILAELPFGICCYRAEEGKDGEVYTFYRANRAFYQCIGCTPEEFKEKEHRFSHMLGADDRIRLRRKEELALNQPGTVYSDIFEVQGKTDSAMFIRWNMKCMTDEEGRRFMIQSCTRVDDLIQGQSMLLDKLNREKQERRKLQDLIYELPVGVAVVKGGPVISIEIVNSEFMTTSGYSVKELAEDRIPFTDYICPADVERFQTAVEVCELQKNTEELELRIITKSGKLRWELVRCRLYYYKDAVPYFILTSWDINERKKLEDELHLMDEQYRMLEEVADEFPFEYDVLKECFRVPQKYYVNGKIADPEKRYMKIAEMLADIQEEDRERYMDAIKEARSSEAKGSVDYRLNISPAGKKSVYVWYRTVYRSITDQDGQITRIIGRSYDISRDRRIQERLSEEMRLDPLTRLYNKVAVGEEVRNFIARKPKGTHVLFLIDIDNFKRINDTYGHSAGDKMIYSIAQVIRNQFRVSDIVGRVGGDEFLVFMKNTTMQDAVEKARQLCIETQKQLVGDLEGCGVTLSVGLSVYGVDGWDYEELFELADRAMYRTKRSGKNNFSFAGRPERERGQDLPGKSD